MTTTARRCAILAVAALAATAGAACTPREAEHTGAVIDWGDGPQYCVVVLDSYPPQCSDGVAVSGWDWAAVEHEQHGGARWGEYVIIGRLGADELTVTGDVREQGS